MVLFIINYTSHLGNSFCYAPHMTKVN